MSLFLNIDTAVETASVCLSRDQEILELIVNDRQQEHAAWLHGAVIAVLESAGYSLTQVDAVGVSIGPGSYTGLRVGLSAAKGFCYALDIPLLAVGTLEIMAYAVRNEAEDLICPLIDARRMEVFTAIFDKKLTEIAKPSAMIIDESSFDALLSTRKILFCGNGTRKLKTVLSNTRASFSETTATAAQLAVLSHLYYQKQAFSNLAYTEPMYIKEFYTTVHKPPA